MFGRRIADDVMMGALQLLGFALVNSVVTAQMASLKNVRKAFLLSPVS